MYDHTSGPEFWKQMYALNTIVFIKSLLTINLKKLKS